MLINQEISRDLGALCQELGSKTKYWGWGGSDSGALIIRKLQRHISIEDLEIDCVSLSATC